MRRPPTYPPDVVRYHTSDTGVYLLRGQIPSGRVTQVLVAQSAGDPAFDRAAARALITWRFKPGAVPYRKIRSVRMSPPQTEHETLARLPVTFVYKKANQAMQRTASKPSTDFLRVCHPRFAYVASCTGLAVADLVSR